MEFTRWLPSAASTEIKMPNPADAFWLSNGVVGTEMLDDEVLFDVNVNDAGIREELEISVRGQKQKVMHSLYFFQFLIGRVSDDDVPANPHFVFKPRVPSRVVTPNGPGGMSGLPGMGGPHHG